MPNLLISLDNTDDVRFEDAGRTPAWFCKAGTLSVGKAVLAKMKQKVRSGPAGTVRLCLHSGPSAAVHDMLIVLGQKRYVRPHAHPEKAETYHIHEGEMAVLTFTAEGKIRSLTHLTPENIFLFRVEAGVYHAAAALTELVVFHESRPGPFVGEAENEFAAWAPDESDVDAAGKYKDDLLAEIGKEIARKA